MFNYINGETNGETVLALGNFDGLHLGHMKVLNKAVEVSKTLGAERAVLLFDEHPKKLLCGERPPMLMADDMKESYLEKIGFKIVKASFSEFKDVSARDFVISLKKDLNVGAICCGFNYRFGKGGEGTAAKLSLLCGRLGIRLYLAGEASYEGEPISSTRIRAALESGNIKAANAMLGRDFSYNLTVVHGDGNGKKYGFPTINQVFDKGFVKPLNGVYCSVVTVDGKRYCGVTNIGVRPTVDGKCDPRSETNIVGFSEDIYGKNVQVELVEFIRPEKKFDGIDKLTEQIALDRELSEKIIGQQGLDL